MATGLLALGFASLLLGSSATRLKKALALLPAALSPSEGMFKFRHEQ